MPFKVQTFTTVDSDYAQEFRYQIDGGVLNAVTLRNAGALTGNNMIFAQLWLCMDTSPSNTDGALLAQGPMGASGAIAWTGHILITSPMAIRAVVWSDYAGVFQVVALATHRPTKQQVEANSAI